MLPFINIAVVLSSEAFDAYRFIPSAGEKRGCGIGNLVLVTTWQHLDITIIASMSCVGYNAWFGFALACLMSWGYWEAKRQLRLEYWNVTPNGRLHGKNIIWDISSGACLLCYLLAFNIRNLEYCISRVESGNSWRDSQSGGWSRKWDLDTSSSSLDFPSVFGHSLYYFFRLSSSAEIKHQGLILCPLITPN